MYIPHTGGKANYAFNSPDSEILTVFEVLPDLEPTPSIALTTSKPSKILPKTTCLPSSHGVVTVVMKN